MKRITITVDSEGDIPADYWQDFAHALHDIVQDMDEDALTGNNDVGFPWTFKIEDI